MTEKVDVKGETLPDLDDLLQCPVCYEIPTGQIFQCNEGHHVCGRCKMRLDVCPVCRAFFFGTRNYAMEELIANVRKLRAFKLGGKITTVTLPDNTVETRQSTSDENESADNEEEEVEEDDTSSRASVQVPKACKGLFRCLCCKDNPERLPSARLLNHLRYYHSPDLIEGRSENGEYLQAWQFSTTPGRLVTAVRITDMGIFFLIIEVTNESVHAWLSMAASPWVAHEFSYTFTLSGNDREAIFSDCVWSVRSCEGSLRKRGRCLSVSGGDARALLAPSSMSAKLAVRRTPPELLPTFTQPRAVLRVANRSNVRDSAPEVVHDLEPVLQDLQNDVARLSRAFATLGREADALVRSEAELRARLENTSSRPGTGTPQPAAPTPPEEDRSPSPPVQNGQVDSTDRSQLSRNARRRMRQRLRDAFREATGSFRDDGSTDMSSSRTSTRDSSQNSNNMRNNSNSHTMSPIHNVHNRNTNRRIHSPLSTPYNRGDSGAPASARRESPGEASPPPPAFPPSPPASGSYPNVNGDAPRNKKKRRQRR